MSLLNKAVREDFVVVSIDSGLSMDANTHAILQPILDASNSSFWELRNPEGYVVYFLSRKSNSREKATSLKSQVDKIILSNQNFKSFSCYIKEGQFVTTINWRGKINSRPLGNATKMITNNQERQ